MKQDEYSKFIRSKIKTVEPSGFDIPEEKLNKNLFNFQRFIVRRALIQIMLDNWPDGQPTKSQAERWLKISTGLCRVEKDIETGEDVVLVNSTAYDSMSQDAYGTWFLEQAIQAIAVKLGMEREELVAEVEQIVCEKVYRLKKQ